MINTTNGTEWAVQVDDGNCRHEIFGEAETLPLAICRAALAALQ